MQGTRGCSELYVYIRLPLVDGSSFESVSFRAMAYVADYANLKLEEGNCIGRNAPTTKSGSLIWRLRVRGFEAFYLQTHTSVESLRWKVPVPL